MVKIDFRGSEGVPLGTYAAEFVGVDEFTNSDRTTCRRL